MNYEAETKKTSNGKLRSSFYWIFYNSNHEARETVRTICIMSTVLAAIMVAQFLMFGTAKEQISEWETSTISKWRVVGKFVDDTYRENTYYLVLQDSKYNWVKEVDAQTYLTHDIGSTIKIEYDKEELLGGSGVSWHVNLVMLLTILSMIIYLAATLFVVSTVMLIDTANIDDFTFNVCRVNNRGLDDLDRHNIKKTYDKYIKILKAVNVFIIIYFIGYTAFMIKQFTFYMGW